MSTIVVPLALDPILSKVLVCRQVLKKVVHEEPEEPTPEESKESVVIPKVVPNGPEIIEEPEALYGYQKEEVGESSDNPILPAEPVEDGELVEMPNEPEEPADEEEEEEENTPAAPEIPPSETPEGKEELIEEPIDKESEEEEEQEPIEEESEPIDDDSDDVDDDDDDDDESVENNQSEEEISPVQVEPISEKVKPKDDFAPKESWENLMEKVPFGRKWLRKRQHKLKKLWKKFNSKHTEKLFNKIRKLEHNIAMKREE